MFKEQLLVTMEAFSSVILIKFIFVDNSANSGGAFRASSSKITLVGTVFQNNEGYNGACLQIDDQTQMSGQNITFSGNTLL